MSHKSHKLTQYTMRYNEQSSSTMWGNMMQYTMRYNTTLAIMCYNAQCCTIHSDHNVQQYAIEYNTI